MVLLQVKQEALAAKGKAMTPAEQEEFKRPILEKYEREGAPWYGSARLWDDGVLDPVRTRDALGLCLAVCARVPGGEPRWPVFRM
jgi:acetyl-CoA carboxylase carboxyltransferase component